FWGADELSRHCGRTKIIEIVVAALRKTYELFWLTREREQPLAEHNRDRRIMFAVHDQQRHIHTGDALVGAKWIAHDEAHGKERKHRRGDVEHRRIRRFQD